MSLEYDIINYLKAHPEKCSREIALSINVPRYAVVFAIAKLLWQQRVELAGYKDENSDGHCHPTYNATTHRGATVH